jgi:hypothetical protein
LLSLRKVSKSLCLYFIVANCFSCAVGTLYVSLERS